MKTITTRTLALTIATAAGLAWITPSLAQSQSVRGDYLRSPSQQPYAQGTYRPYGSNYGYGYGYGRDAYAQQYPNSGYGRTWNQYNSYEDDAYDAQASAGPDGYSAYGYYGYIDSPTQCWTDDGYGRRATCDGGTGN